MFPENSKYKYWLFDKLLIKEGYSKTDIDMMSGEEYDYLVLLIIKEHNKGIGKSPFEGI